MTERTKLRLLFVFLFVLGFVLIAIPWHDWPAVEGHHLPLPLQRLLEGLGEALVIAAVLAVVVDEAAKRDLLKEFTESISTHIVGRLLQPELREHIEQYLKADLVRTTWTITYTLSDVDGHPQHKRLVTESEYEMENRSSSSRDYNCAYDLEASLSPLVGKASIRKVTGTNLVDGIGSFKFPDPVRPELKPVETESSVKFSHHVMIPARQGSPAFAFHIESEEFLPDGSIVPLFAKYLVLSTTLTVNYPVDALSVFVDLSFGDLAEPTILPDGMKWEFNKPMLPGQGFTIRFATKAPQAPAQPVSQK